MGKASLSLIISFYNQIERLELVLASLELQKFKDFEVLIADDGSSEDVTGRLKEIIKAGCLDIRHIWHEDKGWRKNIILNRAAVESRTDYLVFIDGDCVLHPRFLEEHYLAREEGIIAAGRRVNLGPRLSSRLSPSLIRKAKLWKGMLPRMWWESLGQKESHFENAIYLRSNLLRSRINKKDKGILGCNFSIFKTDLLGVNGFDERFLLPAVGEDTDLEMRLRRNGVKIKTLKHIAIQYHLYHKTLPREDPNYVLLEENNKRGVTYTPFGIKK